VVMGIAFEEKHRANRWANDDDVEFPLIDMQIGREGCIALIKEVGWNVPVKSGCWFCPYAKMSEFAELKKTNPLLFSELCEMEKATLENLKHKDRNTKGWYGSQPIDKLVAMKHPEIDEEQMCLYCVDW